MDFTKSRGRFVRPLWLQEDVDPRASSSISRVWLLKWLRRSNLEAEGVLEELSEAGEAPVATPGCAVRRTPRRAQGRRGGCSVDEAMGTWSHWARGRSVGSRGFRMGTDACPVDPRWRGAGGSISSANAPSLGLGNRQVAEADAPVRLGPRERPRGERAHRSAAGKLREETRAGAGGRPSRRRAPVGMPATRPHAAGRFRRPFWSIRKASKMAHPTRGFSRTSGSAPQ